MDKNTKSFQLYSLFHPKVRQQLDGLFIFCVASFVFSIPSPIDIISEFSPNCFLSAFPPTSIQSEASRLLCTLVP